MFFAATFCSISLLAESYSQCAASPLADGPELVRTFDLNLGQFGSRCAILSNCGNYVVVGMTNGRLYFLNLDSGASRSVQTEFRGGLSLPLAAFDNTSQVAIMRIAGKSSAIGIVRARTGETIRRTGLSLTDGDMLLPGLQLFGKGKRVTALCVEGDTNQPLSPVWIGTWSAKLTATRHDVMKVKLSYWPTAYDVSSNGKFAALADDKGQLTVWRVGREYKTVLQRDFSKEGVHGLRFSPNGEYLALTIHSGRVSIYCARSGIEISRTKLEPDYSARSIQFSQAYDVFYASSKKRGVIAVHDSITAKVIREFESHESRLLQMIPHPDGKRLITVNEQSIKIWKLRGIDGKPRPHRPASSTAELWQQLGSDRPQVARSALAVLRANPRSSLEFIEKKLNLGGAQDEQILRLIDGLRSAKSSVRDNSHRQLRVLGYAADPVLQRCTNLEKDPEAKARLARLTSHLALGPRSNIEAIRLLRCAQILERIGSDRATSDLRKIGRFQNRVIVCAASAALKRLAKRTSTCE